MTPELLVSHLCGKMNVEFSRLITLLINNDTLATAEGIHMAAFAAILRQLEKNGRAFLKLGDSIHALLRKRHGEMLGNEATPAIVVTDGKCIKRERGKGKTSAARKFEIRN